MNRLTIAGLVTAGTVIVVDHLVTALPQAIAFPLYTVAIALLIVGMIKSRKA